MNATKLGLRLTSPVLATALALAPISPALAAPPDEDAEAPEGEEAEAPEGEEAEAPEGEEAEGPEGEEAEAPEGEEAEAPEGEEVEAPEGEEAETPEGEGGEIEVGGEDDDLGPTDDFQAEQAEGEDSAIGVEEEGEGEEGIAATAEPDLAPEGPLRPAEPTWGPKDQYPMDGKGMLITGGVVTGLGAAFILTSVLITRCDFDSALSCKYGDQRDFLIPSAVATTGLGLLLLGVGVGNRVRYKRWQNWTPEQTAVVPTMVPGGGGVAWVGRF